MAQLDSRCPRFSKVLGRRLANECGAVLDSAGTIGVALIIEIRHLEKDGNHSTVPGCKIPDVCGKAVIRFQAYN